MSRSSSADVQKSTFSPCTPQPSTPSPSCPQELIVPGSSLNINSTIAVQSATLGYPQGLEILRTIKQLFVRQLVGRFILLCGRENRNQFDIVDGLGAKIYFAWEYTSSWAAECCGSWRPFEMNVKDNDGNMVMRFKHVDFRCMEIEVPPQRTVGFIERQDCITPSFIVQNLNKQTVLYIEGPLNTGNFRGNVNFEVLSADGNTRVGLICKQWSGFFKEMFTDADNFKIVFPAGADIATKASLLGALFMIDMMYYENNACPFLQF